MSLFDKYKERRSERFRLEMEERANDLFQLTEHEGEIWLTYNGSLVCPCQMLKDAPVDASRK